MNIWQNKTPEERKAMIAKGVATRRKNYEEKEAARKEALIYAGGLRGEIAILELKLAGLKRMEIMSTLSAELSCKSLFQEEEIARAALPWESTSGVYFLLKHHKIIYVGQGVNVYARIQQHAHKQFDSYAFVLCPVSALNSLESLYIHYLRPKLNGTQPNGAKFAPISLDKLIHLSGNLNGTKT